MPPLDAFTTPGNWYKGNLHTHTSNSDGKLTPEQVADWYRKRGYDFLSMTDHLVYTDGSALSADEFLVIDGIEFHGRDPAVGGEYHVVGLGSGIERALAGWSEGDSAQQTIDLIVEAGCMAILAHPYGLGQTAHDLLSLRGFLGLEIFNSMFNWMAKGLSVVHWDNLLDAGQRLWGLAVDDSHWNVEDAGEGWIMVKAAALTEEDILNAVRAGQFYATRGPEIVDLRMEDNTLEVVCSPVVEINFTCNRYWGRRVRASEGATLNEASFTLRGGVTYVRVECIDERSRQAWSNPLYIELGSQLQQVEQVTIGCGSEKR